MNIQAINFVDKLALIKDHWQPRVISELNDYQFKLAKLQGDFVWHSHAETDEAFIVLNGELCIEFRDSTVTLKAGEMAVVPKGVEHKPYAKEEVHLLLVEPRGVINTGDGGNAERSAQNDVWV